MNRWMNDPQYLAQIGHTLGGFAVLMLVGVFLGIGALPWTYLAVVIVAAVKEFFYDMRYELPRQTWGDSAMDFAFYLIGSSVGGSVAMLAHHFGRIR